MKLYLETLKKKIQHFLRENVDAPLYVEFLSNMSNEIPFEKSGKKWQFVWAKYPDGRRDIGVYSFSEDLVYAYQAWRKMIGIDKDGENIGASLYDRHFKSDLREADVEDSENNFELDYTDMESEPDFENDAFIEDVVRGGYSVSFSNKFIGNYETIDIALLNLKTEMERSNYFPTIWFFSDHGNYWPIDLNGNEIKNNLQERISPELFKSAINVSRERGTDNRTRKLGSLFFNEFLGKPLMGGKITYIEVNNPKHGNYRDVVITIEYKYSNAPVVPNALKNQHVHYDIDKDIFNIENEEIERKDARLLSLIALKINPNSRFKESGKYFNIKGMNESADINDDSERNKKIASTIINQFGGFGKLKAMTGAYNFVAVENGISFRIKNRSANYIKIILNAKDLYDVEIGRINGTNYKVILNKKDVYAENIKGLIEKETGMYLGLFENISIKNLIENQISNEEESREKLELLKSEGKITLSIGNHGLIFMQIIDGNDLKKSYETYQEAFEHYFYHLANKAAIAQHEMNKMVYKNQIPGYKFDNNQHQKYMKEFTDNTEFIYMENFDLSHKLIKEKLNELSKNEGKEYYNWWLEDQKNEFFNQD